MTVYELNREQLEELKMSYLFDQYVNGPDEEWPSWGEMTNINQLVSDDAVKDYYKGTDFTPDDFCCTAGK